ncbi:MAG: hypothetical protein A2537_00130 [Candidatus Magasanikbacteria bacterium RIFOXYD2_FULL_36_9]|uniref:POTRA domain-containing protein n=1 Tax=Candidatus Magasanikbacteria bacterium RIFOXYD2_FULL_36_9 TaxID=1798707 RepID=A0A1F6P1T6_9BACT|nr:MAG: hypothetical protein A2537_00130 [Candidatus Magasanikbacteria bacterium RIFOXYD2_FULL_36_9]
MQHFHSNKSFNQYKPHQTFWQKLKTKRQKREVAGNLRQSSLKNPFKKEVSTPKNKTKMVWGFLIVLILSWIILILTLPYFKITKIIISGNKITKATEVENFIRQFNFSKTNYFLFPDKSIASKIRQTFLYEGVEIKKVFPDTIQVVVSEKPASIIYDDNQSYYLIDADGKIIKQLNEFLNTGDTNFSTSTSSTTLQNSHLTTYQQIQSEYGDFPVIFNDKTSVSDENKPLSSKVIKNTVDWQRLIKEQGIGEVKYFKIGDTDFNLKIFLNQPWYILVNTELDQHVQFKNLKIILSNNKPAEYIDVRFGERVYWK